MTPATKTSLLALGGVAVGCAAITGLWFYEIERYGLFNKAQPANVRDPAILAVVGIAALALGVQKSCPLLMGAGATAALGGGAAAYSENKRLQRGE